MLPVEVIPGTLAKQVAGGYLVHVPLGEAFLPATSAAESLWEDMDRQRTGFFQIVKSADLPVLAPWSACFQDMTVGQVRWAIVRGTLSERINFVDLGGVDGLLRLDLGLGNQQLAPGQFIRVLVLDIDVNSERITLVPAREWI